MPYPRTWPLLPYPRVSNANTIPMKSPQKQGLKTSIRMQPKQDEIPPISNPTYTSKQQQGTTQYYMQDLSMINMKKTKSKGDDVLPSQEL